MVLLLTIEFLKARRLSSKANQANEGKDIIQKKLSILNLEINNEIKFQLDSINFPINKKHGEKLWRFTDTNGKYRRSREEARVLLQKEARDSWLHCKSIKFTRGSSSRASSNRKIVQRTACAKNLSEVNTITKYASCQPEKIDRSKSVSKKKVVVFHRIFGAGKA